MALLSRKLKRLTRDQMLMTGMAAVLDRPFYDREIVDLTPVEEGRSVIDQLIEEGIFTRHIFGRDEKIYFRHGQLRRAAYDNMSESIRGEMHCRIAGYYASKNESDEFLGRHYALAGDNEKWYLHLFASAQAAMKILAFKQAADLYAAALKCVEASADSPQKRYRLYKTHLGLGQALSFISPRAARKALKEAVAIAESGSLRGSDFAEATLAAGRNYLDLGGSDRALELLRAGLSAAEMEGDRKLQGEGKVGLGFV